MYSHRYLANVSKDRYNGQMDMNLLHTHHESIVRIVACVYEIKLLLGGDINDFARRLRTMALTLWSGTTSRFHLGPLHNMFVGIYLLCC